MKYIVGTGRVVWHSKQDKYYREGETIDLSHLQAEQVKELLTAGVIVEIKVKQETKNG